MKDWKATSAIIGTALLVVAGVVSVICMDVNREPEEKKIDGIICRMYGFSWTPVANLCVNCGRHELSEYCTGCGAKQSLVVCKSVCLKCGKLRWGTDAKYCNIDGGKNILMLVMRAYPNEAVTTTKSCSAEGMIRYVPDASGYKHLELCDGKEWVGIEEINNLRNEKGQ